MTSESPLLPENPAATDPISRGFAAWALFLPTLLVQFALLGAAIWLVPAALPNFWIYVGLSAASMAVTRLLQIPFVNFISKPLDLESAKTPEQRAARAVLYATAFQLRKEIDAESAEFAARAPNWWQKIRNVTQKITGQDDPSMRRPTLRAFKPWVAWIPYMDATHMAYTKRCALIINEKRFTKKFSYKKSRDLIARELWRIKLGYMQAGRITGLIAGTINRALLPILGLLALAVRGASLVISMGTGAISAHQAKKQAQKIHETTSCETAKTTPLLTILHNAEVEWKHNRTATAPGTPARLVCIVNENLDFTTLPPPNPDDPSEPTSITIAEINAVSPAPVAPQASAPPTPPAESFPIF